MKFAHNGELRIELSRLKLSTRIYRNALEARKLGTPLEVRAGHRVGADRAARHGVCICDDLVGQRQVMQNARVAVDVAAAGDFGYDTRHKYPEYTEQHCSSQPHLIVVDISHSRS